MDRLTQRIEVARQALRTLAEVTGRDPVSAIVRDAAIQRFEYSFEATWKALQAWLGEHEGIQAGSPKGVFRACFQTGLMDEQQSRLALAMVDDRNLTTHTYNEGLAARIYLALSAYEGLMSGYLRTVSEQSQKRAP